MNKTGKGTFKKNQVPWNKGKQFCPKGHDTFITGRTKNGNCKQCQQDGNKERSRNKPIKIKTNLCPKGHDKSIVGKTKDGSCQECTRVRQRQKYIPNPRKPKQFCVHGHDTFVVGRNTKSVCKMCIKLNYRENKLNGKVDDYYLKKFYGITLKDKHRMLKEQNNSCLGCNRKDSEFKKGLFVDHDHKTGKVRGLLCGDCNTIIGLAKDDVRILQSLIIYLEKRT